MATRMGLLRARGRSRGAQLVQGQQQFCNVRLLARLTSRSTDKGAVRNSSSIAPASSLACSFSACGQRYPSSFLLLGRRNSSSAKALFSSTARPSQDEGETKDVHTDDSKPKRTMFGRERSKDRLARLDDGDKYEDFVDLRLAEAEKLFPEGLAGGGQGALARAMTMGKSTALLQREAAEALIHSLDSFTSAGANGAGGAPYGIEGHLSEKWRNVIRTRYGRSASTRQGDGNEQGVGGGSGAKVPDSEDHHDDIIGDIRAAEAEGAAAAAAAAEAVAAAAMAEAGREAGVGTGEEESEQEGDGVGNEKKTTLGSGPIWEEMKALAESKRKHLDQMRRVEFQDGQRSYLLTGRRGSGKSCVLNHAVLHARSTGWIVIFVPDGRNLVQKGIYCQPSPVLEGLYDLPIQSLKRLKSLRDAHGDQLKGISVKNPEVLARHEGAETVLDVVDLGLGNEELAGTAHYDVMKELLSTTEAKVMLAIDEYNELFQMSHWHFGDDKLEAPHLTATLPLVPPLVSTNTGLVFADDSLAALANPDAAILKKAKLDAETGAACLPSPPANGIVVCAMTGRYPPKIKLRKKKWVPFEATAGRLAKAVSIPVEPYSRREFLRVLKHYARVEEVVNAPLGMMQVAKVHAKSDGLAEHVFETCRSGRYHTVHD